MSNPNQMIEFFKAQAIMQSDNVVYSLIIFSLIDILGGILKELAAAAKTYIDSLVTRVTTQVTTTLPSVQLVEAELSFSRSYKTDAEMDWDQADAVLHHALSVPAASSIVILGQTQLVQNKKRFTIDSCGIDLCILTLDVNPEKGQINFITFKVISNKLNVCQLRDWVQTITEKYVSDKKNGFGNTRYYFDQIVEKRDKTSRHSEPLRPNATFSIHKFTSNRNLDNVFHDRQDEITNRIRFFLNNREWYDTRGIPYTFGMLLYGPPGTGKTSTIKAIAKEADRHIININLGAIRTRKQLKKLFYDDRLQVYKTTDNISIQPTEYIIPIDKRMYVLEDFDATTESKFLAKRGEYTPVVSEDRDESDLDLATLLNVIDGTLETPGRIIIMTSNHPEMIDEALIRPGRIDLIVEYGKCSKRVIANMWNSFYAESRTPEEFSACENKWTPAQVGQVLFKNFDNRASAKDELINSKPHTFEDPLPSLEPDPQYEVPTSDTLTRYLYNYFVKILYAKMYPDEAESDVVTHLINSQQLPMATAYLMIQDDRVLSDQELTSATSTSYKHSDGTVQVPSDYQFILDTLGPDLVTSHVAHALNVEPSNVLYTSLPELVKGHIKGQLSL